jgi:protein-disulfide isomerase|tara:strand:+ start:2175 stop:2837 length:663 start_codon:yes stop_codon:yes gene_type:complete
MSNKKTIILGLIAILILAGIVWYAGEYGEGLTDQTAAIVDNIEEQSPIVDTSVNLAEELITGDPEAPVTMVEYSSHFCGFCAKFHQETLPLIMDKYIKTGQVKLVSRLVSPLELGLNVLCADEQEAFPEMNEYLFEHAGELGSVEDLKAIAGTLGLDQDQFDECFDSARHENKVKTWFEQATQDQVSGTPTFFINGHKIVGNQPYEVIEQAIEDALNQTP